MKSTRSFLFPLFILSIGLFYLFDYFMKVNDKKIIHFIASFSGQVSLNTFALMKLNMFLFCHGADCDDCQIQSRRLPGVRCVTVSVRRFYSFSFSRQKVHGSHVININR